MKYTLKRLWHDIFGHPKSECKYHDVLEVKCSCGRIIGLNDYY